MPRITCGAPVRLLLLAALVPTITFQGFGEETSANPILGLTFRQIVTALEDGRLTLDEVRRAGMEVFTRPFTRTEGFGDGPFNPTETPNLLPGNRPTLQGNGTTLLLNGLDAQSCNECHSIVSHDTVPPTLGIGGVGGLVQNAIIRPTLIDVSDSADPRVFGSAPGGGLLTPDGVADFNGRISNPPFIYGGGGVELLAKEMTADLQGFLQQARAEAPGTITSLLTHGVDFGFLRTEAPGVVDLDGIEGIGFEDNDGRRPEEVLVVRPFGRKGERATMRAFDRGAMEFHFGIQPTEVVGNGVDADGDGVVNEISDGAMTALHIFDVTNPSPVMQSLDERSEAGFDTFQRIGCADCHRPVLETRSSYLPLAYPEVPEDPQANVYRSIDLVEAGFAPSPNGGCLRAAVRRPEALRDGTGIGGNGPFRRHRQRRVHDGEALGHGRHGSLSPRRTGTGHPRCHRGPWRRFPPRARRLRQPRPGPSGRPHLLSQEAAGARESERGVARLKAGRRDPCGQSAAGEPHGVPGRGASFG